MIAYLPFLPKSIGTNSSAEIAALETRVDDLETDLANEATARADRDDEIVTAYNSHFHGLLGLAGTPTPEVSE